MKKRFFALLCALVLLCAAIPVSVFAADGNVQSNGSFDSGVNGWTASKGTTAKPENGAMFVDFNEDWGFVRTDITLKKNTTYVLTFDGKTNSARYVNVKLNKPDWRPLSRSLSYSRHRQNTLSDKRKAPSSRPLIQPAQSR